MIEILANPELMWPLFALSFLFIAVGGAVLSNGRHKPKREILTFTAVLVLGIACLIAAFAGAAHSDNVQYNHFEKRCHAAGGNLIVDRNQTCVKGKVLF